MVFRQGPELRNGLHGSNAASSSTTSKQNHSEHFAQRLAVDIAGAAQAVEAMCLWNCLCSFRFHIISYAQQYCLSLGRVQVQSVRILRLHGWSWWKASCNTMALRPCSLQRLATLGLRWSCCGSPSASQLGSDHFALPWSLQRHDEHHRLSGVLQSCQPSPMRTRLRCGNLPAGPLGWLDSYPLIRSLIIVLHSRHQENLRIGHNSQLLPFLKFRSRSD